MILVVDDDDDCIIFYRDFLGKLAYQLIFPVGNKEIISSGKRKRVVNEDLQDVRWHHFMWWMIILILTGIQVIVHDIGSLIDLEDYSHYKGTTKRARRRCCVQTCKEIGKKTSYFCKTCSNIPQNFIVSICNNQFCIKQHEIDSNKVKEDAK